MTDGDIYAAADAAMRGRRFALAAVAFKNLVETSGSLRALCGLASAQLELGDVQAAHEIAARAVERDPSSVPARMVMARVYLSLGDYGAAEAAFREIAAIKGQRLSESLQTYRIPAHFALHNLEQWEYLLRNGVDAPELHCVSAAERAALREQLVGMIERHQGEAPWVSVSGVNGKLLADLPHVRAKVVASSPHLNRDVDFASIDQALCRAQPRVHVIDDFLSPAALTTLRHFCLGSTIWRFPYKFGYVAAFPEDGMVLPSIFAIAEELSLRLPETLRDHRLTQWWCFAYDAELPGTAVHADDSDVSLNLWLTPDSALMDRESGGLVVWDKLAPDEWTFDEMNSGGERIRSYLREQGAQRRIISYRENRAVIFAGRLFHETDRARFARGFESRRRNLTLLFRRRR